MSAEAARLAEYTALRAEILQSETKARDVLVAVSAAVGAILAFWLGMIGGKDTAQPLPPSQFLFAVVTVTLALLATGLAGILVASYRRSTWRIATYMIVFLEPRVEGLGWETRLDADSRRGGAGRFSPEQAGSSGGIGSDRWVLIFLQLICMLAIILFVVVQWVDVNERLASEALKPAERMHLWIGMGLAALHLAVFLALATATWRSFAALGRRGAVRQTFLDRWRSLHDAERAA